MPEGDTLARTARTLARAMNGKTIARVASPEDAIAHAGLVGHRVALVEARGKNLLVRFDDGRALHTHMRMHGSWHLYRAGERWQKPEHLARIAIELEATERDPALIAVCFEAPVVRLLRAGDGVEVGPDLLTAQFDEADALARLRALGATPVGEAIVHQRALAGIGNIYKSEVLFACRIDPFAAVASLDDAALRSLVDRARRVMQRNTVGRGSRTTTARFRHGSAFAVYDRSGKPCFTCGDTIRMRRQGALHRSTYFCPTCQSVASDASHAPHAQASRLPRG